MDTRRFNRTYFWQRSPFFRYLPPLVLSIVCYDRHIFTGSGVLTGLVLTLLFLSLFAALTFYRSTAAAKDYLLFITLQAAIFFLGNTVCQLRDITTHADWLGKGMNPEAAYIGRIEGSPVIKPKTIRLYVSITEKVEENAVTPCAGKAILYVYNSNLSKTFTPGETILIPGKWQQITNHNTPFGFNYAGYCARNGIYHQQFLPQGQVQQLKEIPVHQNIFQKIHNLCMARLAQHVQDKPTMGLLQAMITGEETNLDPEIRDQYAQTGIVHMIAISGSHVANLFFLLSLCLFWIKKDKHQWIKYALGILFIWLYVLMAGAPPSAVRSAIMFSSISLGFILNKDRNTLNNLFVAAFITLLWQPTWLFSVGFQLSFIAVLSLVLFYQPVNRLVKPGNRFVKAVWNIIAASIAVELLVAPLVIYYFHMLPLVSVVANLAGWGLTAFALITGTLIILLSGFSNVANGIAAFTSWCIHYFNNLISFLQQFNPQAFSYFQISFAELTLLYLCIALAAIIILRSSVRLVLPFSFFFCLLMAMLVKDQWTARQQERLAIFYHSGKGSIVHIDGTYFESADDSLNMLKDYNARAALTGWHSWKKSEQILRPAYRIGDENILIMDKNVVVDSLASYPVDVLIVSGSLKQQSFTTLKRVFSPGQLVVTDKQHPKLAKKWQDSCNAANIRFSTAQKEGVIVIE